MRTKRYVDGGSVFTPVGNRQQPNANPQPQPGQPGPLAQPGQATASSGDATPYPPTFTSGIASQEPSFDVGEPSSSVPPPTAGRAFRKGGYVKAADGIAQRGKTKGRMA